MSEAEDAAKAAPRKAAEAERARMAEVVRRARAAAVSVRGSGPGYSPISNSLVSNVILRGYSSFQGAIDQARQVWGRAEAWRRFLGFLVDGSIKSFAVNKMAIPWLLPRIFGGAISAALIGTKVLSAIVRRFEAKPRLSF
jgi:hypothetical protein